MSDRFIYIEPALLEASPVGFFWPFAVLLALGAGFVIGHVVALREGR